MKAPGTADPIARLKALVREHGSQGAAAEALGISHSYFSQMLAGWRPFSDAMLDKLGLERVVRIVEKAS